MVMSFLQNFLAWEICEVYRDNQTISLNIDYGSMSLAFNKRALQKVQRNVPSTGIHLLERGSRGWSRNLDPGRCFQRRHLTIDELNQHKQGTKTLSYYIIFTNKNQIENV